LDIKEKISKAKPRRTMPKFGRTRAGPGARKAEARSKALAFKVKDIFDRLYRSLVEEEIRRLKSVIRKNSDRERVIEQLATALALSGMREVKDAGRRNSRRFELSPTWYDSYFKEKREEAVALITETEKEFRVKFRESLNRWLNEDPDLTHADLARRIRFSYFAEGYEVLAPRQKPTRGVLEPLEQGPKITRDALSRASLIARTELAMSQNRGAYEGLKASGAEYLKWVSQLSDGGRGHQEMNNEIVRAGEDFILPDGTPMAAPGLGKVTEIGQAPIKHTANCRCTIVRATRREIREYKRRRGITDD
jgi:hypothetical protein